MSDILFVCIVGIISYVVFQQLAYRVHSGWTANRSATVPMKLNVTTSTVVVLMTCVNLVGEETIVALVIRFSVFLI